LLIVQKRRAFPGMKSFHLATREHIERFIINVTGLIIERTNQNQLPIRISQKPFEYSVYQLQKGITSLFYA
jgi:hypothetical protein